MLAIMKIFSNSFVLLLDLLDVDCGFRTLQQKKDFEGGHLYDYECRSSMITTVAVIFI